MKRVLVLLLTIVITQSFFLTQGNSQRPTKLQDVQNRIFKLQRQIAQKGEYETIPEYEARVKELKAKIYELVPETYERFGKATFDMYNPDVEILPVTVTSEGTKLGFTYSVPRDDAKRIKEAANKSVAILWVGIDENGGLVPAAAQVKVAGKIIRHRNNQANIAAIHLVRSLATGASSIALSPPDGKLLAVAEGNQIKLFDIATGNAISVFSDHSKPVVNVVFSPDGKLLASADESVVKVWETSFGHVLKTFARDRDWLPYLFLPNQFGAGERSSAISLAFSQDGSQLAIGDGYAILLADVSRLSGSGGRGELEPRRLAMSDSVRDRLISQFQSEYEKSRKGLDDPFLLPAFKEGIKRDMYNIEHHMSSLREGKFAHSRAGVSVVFPPTGRELLSTSPAEDDAAALREGRRIVKTWNLDNRSEVKTRSVRGELSSDGRFLVSWGDYVNRMTLSPFDSPGQSKLLLSQGTFAISSDGKTLATNIGSMLGCCPIYLYDIGTESQLVGPQETIENARQLAFSANGKTLACLSQDGKIFLWEIVYRSIGVEDSDMPITPSREPGSTLQAESPQTHLEGLSNTIDGQKSSDLSEESRKELSSLEGEYQTKAYEYNRKKDLLSDAAKAQVQKDLDELQKRIVMVKSGKRATGDKPTPQSQINLGGTWTGSGSDNSGPGTLVFVLTHSGNEVAGTCTIMDPKSGAGFAGTLKGTTTTDGCEFILTAKYQKCDISIKFFGTVSGSTMSGFYSGSNSCSGPVTDGKFNVARQ